MNDNLASKSLSQKLRIRISLIILIGVFIVGLIALLVTRTYSYYHVDLPSNVVIRAYPSLVHADITLRVYMQNRNSSGTAIANSYSQIYYIPRVHYTYNSAKTVCTDGITITWNSSTYSFDINAANRGVCSVYFDAAGTYISDQNLRICVKNKGGYSYDQNGCSDGYYENGQIPQDGYTYTIKETKCTSGSITSIKIVNGLFEITAKNNYDCTVYLD